MDQAGPDDAYFDTPRREVLPVLPARVARLLDVGCGTGATTQAIREARKVEWAGGIEYLPDVAARAAPRFDRIWTGDAALAPLEAEIPPSSLDLVLCLDVLEHMADPWSFVRRATALLAPEGRLIVSVPNIRNWRFIRNLALRGDFHYRDFGLLDRTHLRFFVRATAIELATCGGLSLVEAHSVQQWRAPDWRWLAHRLTGGRSDELTAKQWLVVAARTIDR